MSLANYTCGIIVLAKIIWVVDGDEGNMSVTNDAETVVQEVVEKYGDHPIVYQDSTGRWDELEHVHGSFTGFKFIGCRHLSEAVLIMQKRKP